MWAGLLCAAMLLGNDAWGATGGHGSVAATAARMGSSVVLVVVGWVAYGAWRASRVGPYSLYVALGMTLGAVGDFFNAGLLDFVPISDPVLGGITAFGLGHEPMVQESLTAGAALVMFSGDKLLGGPQAGILVGHEVLLARLRKHPLARALRADKLCLAALEATLLHYARGEALQALPVWQMIAAPLTPLRVRAERWAAELGQGQAIESRSTVGGGSLPEETLPTWALALSLPKPQTVLARLRQASPPIIARVEEQRVLLDPRTVLPDQDEMLLRQLAEALAASATTQTGKAS
jgi:L-seryl-tRNA(Ser) seleniumtransferase